MIGALEGQSRMARLLVTVDDPLNQASSAGDNLPPLLIGEFVEAQIEAKPVRDVVRMRQDYLRNNDTVWVKEDGKLMIKELDIIFRDEQFVYIKSGIDKNAMVVTTNLSTVVNEAPLRLKGEGDEL